jgi:threonine synthase
VTPPPRLATTIGIMSTSSARYVSTRSPVSNLAPETDFSDALLRGIAPDGGLYMPTAWPGLSPDSLDWKGRLQSRSRCKPSPPSSATPCPTARWSVRWID